ncbi:MAG: serine/threonine-protein kinase [Thermodesulfobacteriota bacterium]
MALNKSMLSTLLVAVVALVFAGLSFFRFDPLESVDRALYDVGVKFTRAGKAASVPVALVMVDERSAQRLGPWPWPRHILAEMITLLGSQGAKVVGVDLSLSERMPGQGLREMRAFRDKFDSYTFSKKDDGLRSWILENLKELEQRLDNDGKLVEGVRQSGNVVLTVFPSGAKGKSETDKGRDAPVTRNALPDAGIPNELKERVSVPGVSLPFPELSEAALGLGHVAWSFEKGMEGRSHPLFILHRGSILPSFALRLAMAHLGVQPRQGVVEDVQVRVKDIAIPHQHGEMLMDFGLPPEALPRFSFGDLLQAGKIPPAVRGKTVLIGLDLEDSRILSTPAGRPITRTEFFAQAVGSILGRSFLSRPAYMMYMEIVAVLAVGLLGLILFPRMGHLTRPGTTVVLCALLLVTVATLLSRGLWMKPSYALGCAVFSYLAVTLAEILGEERMTRESIESNRLMGLSFQSQGLLDLAFDKFRKLPLDQDTRDLVYNLGLEYERRRMINKALAAYEYIQKGGGFRDLADRIPRLKESDKSSTLGSHAVAAEGVSPGGTPTDETRTGVGRYQIIQELGKGSMGLVYKALDPKINRMLAIKTIRFSDEFDEDVIHEIKERFFREAEIAGRLSHPSIVIIYDVGEDRDLTYMAMEFLEGDDLEKFISKKTLLPLRKVLDVVANVADALDYAHREGVIHRDVKPANIMLLRSGGVKVTDFGIAKAISSSRTKTGVILGTPNYMSPEQIMGQKIDQRSDIFSLGVLFYQLLSGELPFHGDNLSSLLYQITQVKPVPIRNHDPRIPRACEQIIEKALTKNPDDRFKNAGEMRRLLSLVASKLDQMRKSRMTEAGTAPLA